MFKKIIFIVLGISVVLLALTGVLKICPPQGPWPMPPWCGGDGYQIRIPKISIPKFQIPSLGSPATSDQPTPGIKPETKPAAIKPAAPFVIDFTVQVPENTPNHTIIYLQIGEGLNEWGRNFKMEKTV